MSLMKVGYHKTYLLSAIILKNLVSHLSDTGHFMINIWEFQTTSWIFTKLCVLVVLMVLSIHTNFGLVSGLWPLLV